MFPLRRSTLPSCCIPRITSDLVPISQTLNTTLQTRPSLALLCPLHSFWLLTAHISRAADCETKRALAQFGYLLGFGNGGHNGASWSINTFPRTDLENPNASRSPTRVLRFLRALFPAQIKPHRAAGFQPHTLPPTFFFSTPFLPTTRKLTRLAQNHQEALHFHHGYACSLAAKEAHASHGPVAPRFGQSDRRRNRQRCIRPRIVARAQTRVARSSHRRDGWRGDAHHTGQDPA